ncbi:hypothetical protein [Pantoea stewartii]|uniref:hypothetical protein n=1 Tax=Pantoea stewartii TaxID=66269 RepID=UPI00092E5AEA
MRARQPERVSDAEQVQLFADAPAYPPDFLNRLTPLSRAGVFSGCVKADFSGMFLSVFFFPVFFFQVFIFSVFASLFSLWLFSKQTPVNHGPLRLLPWRAVVSLTPLRRQSRPAPPNPQAGSCRV